MKTSIFILMFALICGSSYSQKDSLNQKKPIIYGSSEYKASLDRFYYKNPNSASKKWKEEHPDYVDSVKKNTKLSVIVSNEGTYSSGDDGTGIKGMGIVLSVIGFPVLSTGIVLNIKYMNAKVPDNIDNYKTAQYLFYGGLITSILGTYCIISGNNKIIRYKINNLKIQSYVSPKSTGLTLSYKF